MPSRLAAALPRAPVRPGGRTAALLVSVLLGAVYLRWQPQAPDLPAQLARAAAYDQGARLWWGGWYGGVETATYSVLSPVAMHVLGVAGLGVVATIAVSVASADLLSRCPRPRTGSVLVALAAVANLFSGRITFAAGMAVGLAGCCALQRGRTALALTCCAVVGLFSPLAAMYVVVGLVALWLSQPGRRRLVVALAVAAGLPVVALSALSSVPSRMPDSLDDAVLPLLVLVAFTALRVPKLPLALAGVAAAVAVVALIVPSPIGSNAARLPMLAALPVATACASSRRWVTGTVAALLLAWPLSSFVSDMTIAGAASTRPEFYTALLDHLPAPGRAVQRVEVVEPSSHASSYRVAEQVPLARGWERQVDLAENPIFYRPTLTAGDYRDWLVQHAVGWVAVPRGPVDWASTSEARLLSQPPSFLSLVWRDATWRLYRVQVPSPASSGALRTVSLDTSGVHLIASSPGPALIRVAYSRLLTLHSLDQPGLSPCLRATPRGLLVSVPRAGRWLLTADATALLHPCQGGQHAP